MPFILVRRRGDDSTYLVDGLTVVSASCVIIGYWWRSHLVSLGAA